MAFSDDPGCRVRFPARGDSSVDVAPSSSVAASDLDTFARGDAAALAAAAAAFLRALRGGCWKTGRLLWLSKSVGRSHWLAPVKVFQ